MYYIICNPVAGNGHAPKVLEKIVNVLKQKKLLFQVKNTSCPGHATRLAQEAVDERAETVLSVGGDGTAYEVALALRGTNTALGIIPAGTGNDFIKTLGYPKDPMKALEYVLSHHAVKTDLGCLNDHIFLNETGTGFDVAVLDYAQKAKKYCRGLLPYLYGVICTIIHYKPMLLTYQIENQTPVTENVLVCAVANGGIIGGGIPIAPKAQVDDGLFDVVIVRDVPKKRLIRYLPKLLSGKILTFPETLYCRAKRVIFSATDMRVNIDGEIQPMPAVRLAIDEGALYVHR